MRILSLTAGAADMYCGSCLRDNALAKQLLKLGHDVILTPVYTPTKVDEQNVSSDRVLFGGISVYLQQQSAIFRHTPWLLDRLWDSGWALRKAAERSLSVNPKFLGEMTVSMLEGDEGPLAKEFHKLEHWLHAERRPDVINLPNSMLIALARSIKRVFSGPVVVTMQGEDLFLDNLSEPFRSTALKLIAEQVRHVDAFLSISEEYAVAMASYLKIPLNKIHIVRLGVEAGDFREAAPPESPFRLGYLARIAPEKGLHLLCEAWRRFRAHFKGPARLEVGGYLAAEHQAYLDGIRREMQEAGFGEEFAYLGELDRQQKIQFLSSLHAFSVPVVYDDPKGLYVLEAMASSVPVIAPRRGALPEHIERCAGGILVAPDDAEAIAEALVRLEGDRAAARELGRAGRLGVGRDYGVARMANETLNVYQSLLAPATVATA